MIAAVLIAVLPLAIMASAAAWQWRQHDDARRELECVSVRFGRGLEVEAIAAFLIGWTGTLPPWWKRWLGSPVLTCEIEATAGGISHRLIVTRHSLPTLEHLLQAHLPSSRYEVAELVDVPELMTGVEYRLNTGVRPLQGDPLAIATTLLTNLQPLEPDETVVVQWQLTAAAPNRVVRVAKPNSSPSTFGWLWPDHHTVPSAEVARSLKLKQTRPQLLGTARIGVATSNVKRARHLLRLAEHAWHGSRGSGVHLRRRYLPSRWVAARLRSRRWPLHDWPGIYGPDELVSLLGWPLGTRQLPGLVVAGSRLLAPAPSIESYGTVLGVSNFPGQNRPIAISGSARLHHCYCIGRTGVGKSTLMLHAIGQDIASGHGVVLLDPKGDLVTDVLARVPAHRQRDVIVLDAADHHDEVVGINPLAGTHGSPELMVEHLIAILHNLFHSSWGPRTADVLRASLFSLVRLPGATLCEVPVLLSDPAFRRHVTSQLDDHYLAGFWSWYENLSSGEQAVVVGPVMNKVRAFTLRASIRGVIGQSSPKLDLAKVMSEGRILLVSLSEGQIGHEAAALLGSLVTAMLWQATQARASVPPAQRRPVFGYLDEFANFVNLDVPLGEVLAQARGLGLGLFLAHQGLHQLPTALRADVLTNARSKLIFACSASDSTVLAREIGGDITADDLRDLAAHELVASLHTGAGTAPPVTVRTLAPTEAITDPEQLAASARARYGLSRAAIEAERRAFQTPPNSGTPLRRKATGGRP